MKTRIKDIKYSFLYIIFEGLAKGGNQVLLLCIATFISNDLYLKMLLLISLQMILTMFLMPNYTDVLYAIDINKQKKAYKSSILLFAIFQYIIYVGVYYVIKSWFYKFYEYNNDILIFIILGIGLISCMVRFDSVELQLEGNHSKAIVYRSLPFGFSFIFSLIFFFLGDDKILSFFLGQLLGLVLFYIYILFSQKDINFKHFKLNLIFNYLLRAKYSFLVAILGWTGGLGFLNFAKIFVENKSDLINIGYAVNVFSIFLLLAYGIDQVFVPKLKSVYHVSILKAKRLSQKVHILYFFIFLIGLLIFLINKYFILRFIVSDNKAMENVLNIFNATPIALFIFLLSSFHWVSTPFFQIMDIYKRYFQLNLISYIIPWILIFISVYYGYTNFIILYLLLWSLKTILPYLYIRNRVNKCSNESYELDRK